MNTSSRFRDVETEELIQDQQQRIRELEQQNGLLKVMYIFIPITLFPLKAFFSIKKYILQSKHTRHKL